MQLSQAQAKDVTTVSFEYIQEYHVAGCTNGSGMADLDQVTIAV